jgi:hypothetical protein
MRRLHDFDEYDEMQFSKAKDILNRIYEYHYGDSHMRGKLNRLYTIITKIEQLEAKIGEKENEIR